MAQARHDSVVIVFGFDPGGAKRFGCARLDSQNGQFNTHSASSVDEAVKWVRSLHEQPQGAGIDTLLFWQSTPSGWRGADEHLRETYPDSTNSVMAANSMYGAMSVQGAVLARRLREIWPSLLLTETHPKVLWRHLGLEYPTKHDWRASFPVSVSNWLKKENLTGMLKSEHEFDALLSAWAALNALTKEWTFDLSKIAARHQQNENVSVVDNVHYFWPQKNVL